MNRYRTPTFYKFFAGFVVIIVAAFMLLSHFVKDLPQTPPVDNTAQTQ
jgi:hypothetical protein